MEKNETFLKGAQGYSKQCLSQEPYLFFVVAQVIESDAELNETHHHHWGSEHFSPQQTKLLPPQEQSKRTICLKEQSRGICVIGIISGAE